MKAIWNIPKQVLLALVSFEAWFLAFVFAGNFKAAPIFRAIPLDLTLVLFCVSLFSGLLVTLRQGAISRESIILSFIGLLFCILPLTSLIWTPGVEYARQKAVSVLGLTLWSLVGAAVIIGSRQVRLRRFAAILATGAVAVAIVFLATHLRIGFGNNARFTVLGANYLMVGRLVGLGAQILAAVYWCWDLRWPVRAVVAVVLVFLWVTLFDVASRAPILGCALGFILPLLLRFDSAMVRRARSWKGLAIALCAAAVAAAAAFLFRETYGAFPYGVTRLLRLRTGVFGTSNDERVFYMGKAIVLWQRRPIIGYGCGSFPLLIGRADAKLHPHNIVLEIMVELGLVGLGLFATLNYYAARLLGPWRRLRSDPYRMLVLMLYMGTLVNAMVSGDLHENRALFMMLGLFAFARAGSSLSVPGGNSRLSCSEVAEGQEVRSPGRGSDTARQ